MLVFDVKNRCWSKEMMNICGISEDQLAHIYESYETVGTLTDEAAKELGLPNSVKVAAGAGDNAAAAVGTGTVGDGNCNISLGTSGTVLISSKNFLLLVPCNPHNQQEFSSAPISPPLSVFVKYFMNKNRSTFLLYPKFYKAICIHPVILIHIKDLSCIRF